MFQVGCSDDGGAPLPEVDTAGLCVTPLAPDEPLCSTAFGDVTWPGSHRSSYAQGSSGLRGPSADASVTTEHLSDVLGLPIIMAFGPPYDDGGIAVWSTAVGLQNAIFKIDHERFEIIDTYVPGEREENAPAVPLGVSGTYTAVDASNRFIVGRTRFVSFYGDSVEGDRFSPIALKKRIFMPDEVFCNEDDIIAGMTLTYDGYLVFATELGNVFVIPADAEEGDLGEVPFASWVANCGATDPSEAEIVSNSVAADENGGIYVVTSAAMYRFQWDGEELVQSWRAEYESSAMQNPIRIGPGSGSTPSLMGTRVSDDRFVVITDGRELIHLVLFWRDEIPTDWEAIAPGKDPRIACEVPIRFGVPSATASASEQSVLVRGHSAIVVNDLLTDPTVIPGGGPAQSAVAALEGGIPEKAPFGLERVDWDPEAKACVSVWANPDISIPNGIPSMSAVTGLIYGLGQRNGQFGLEGVDFENGEVRLWAPAGAGVCDQERIAPVMFLPGVSDVLEAVPNSCENSAYAATTVGPDGMIYTGTFFGVTRYVPDLVEQLDPSARAAAGIDQALDLLLRAEAGAGSGAISVRDLLRRAFLQLSETSESAMDGGLGEINTAARDAQRSVAAAIDALDLGASIESDVAAARTRLMEAQ